MSLTLYSLCGTDPNRPFSPHCWKIVMALHHKGLAFEERPLPFTEIPKAEDGFSKTVPIVRDGDQLVSDSFRIALYLEEAYPEHPSLFGGEGGKAAARLVEGYAQNIVHPVITRIAVFDIHQMLGPTDQDYFRASREKFLGRPLEEVHAERAAAIAALPGQLQPLRHMLGFQPFIGGQSPLFADYILFGALQWLRITTGSIHLPDGDPVLGWFERCLELHEGVGRQVA
ncbi:beta-aryl ether-cleaving protein [Rhizobium sp. Root274]|uniref:glutathione S-transferase family protein n=1 Tax=unclassified Rhizobium TaxID=2613769 RepID=UPI00071623EC|nr:MULTISPECIES: glutathione S-transferase family protein [unclassified Rhizobium]KQW32252.1 beta-aryl ether-cleaving protein [Rhizobium sp. Root1240]KRD32526.1 beta-aryl ether-cleaving protein [Rhizobium sp. Root274]